MIQFDLTFLPHTTLAYSAASLSPQCVGVMMMVNLSVSIQGGGGQRKKFSLMHNNSSVVLPMWLSG